MHPSLSPSQTDAIQIDRHLAVEAGAGAGKTTVLVARYLAILAANPTLTPANILTITFTTKAAGELQERIESAIRERPADTLTDRIQTLTWQQGLDTAAIGTIASFCAKILRQWGYLLQIDPQFKIVDDWECKLVWNQTMDNWVEDALARAYPPLIDAMTTTPLAQLKTNWHRALSKRDAANGVANPVVADLIQAYEMQLMNAQKLDFSMIQSKTHALLTSYPFVADAIAAMFPYIMIDEFQDTDPIQWAILQSITQINSVSPRCNVFVVGDIKQSIYGFRGSDPSLFQGIISEFKGRPDADVIHLADNFRSQAPLITFYNTLFSRVFSENRSFPIQYTPLRSNRPALSHGVDILLSETTQKEPIDVCNWLIDAHENGLAWQQCAVIARTGAALTKLSQQLAAVGIPYTMLSQQNPFHRPSVQGILSLVCYVLDPSRPEHRFGYLSSPWAIRLNADWQSSVLEKGYLHVFDHVFLNDPDWYWVRPIIARPVAPNHILTHIHSLLTETNLPTSPNRSESSVTLMTIHAAKGLEFDTVIMIGNGNSRKKQGPSPSMEHTDSDDSIDDETPSDSDEERRIFYVGCTRAKTHLLLSGTLPNAKSESDDRPSSYFDMVLKHATISESDITIVFPGDPVPYQIKRVLPRSKSLPLPHDSATFSPPTQPIANQDSTPYSDPFGSIPDREISVSHLVNWITCRRRYDLRAIINGLIKPDGGDQAIKIGTLVHRLIEHRLRGFPVDSDTVLRLGQATQAPPVVQSIALNQVNGLINTPDFLEIYNDGICKPELDILTRIGSFWIKGRIDCLTQRSTKPWIITDFKTGVQPVAINNRHWTQLMIYSVCIEQRYGITSEISLNLVYTQSKTVLNRVVSQSERATLRRLIEELPTRAFTPPDQTVCAECPVYAWIPTCPNYPTIRSEIGNSN